MTSQSREPSPTLRALLSALVDYAGLFPPAALSMGEAAAEFASQLDGPTSWALGRFIAPATRLDDLAVASARFTARRRAPWRVSALLGDAGSEEMSRIRAFNAAQAGRLIVDTLECRATTPATIASVAGAARRDFVTFFELPIDHDPAALLIAVREHGALAKVRTGGVTPDAFPSAAKLARFIGRCAELGVPFKATAGLHHPLRSEQRLTYASDAPCGTMFGFLNVFVAAALAHARGGVDEVGIARLLEERDPAAFDFGTTTLRWRDYTLDVSEVSVARRAFALSFGSCSFREPIDDLRHLGLP